MAKRHLQHIKSATANKAPASNDLLYGEIAVNYAKGSETLFIKNSNNEIVQFPNSKVIEDNEEVIARALVDLDERVSSNRDDILAINTDNMVSITYSELKVLRDSSRLQPGMNYRITDYVTTTAQADTMSAGHQFDIVVMALDNRTLSENAHAMKHEGDTYFNQSVITAWELKYTIDNLIGDFAWADTTNGKGVIFYMKDEYNNECSYDFKNIMFKKYKVTAVDSNNFIDDANNSVASAVLYTNRYPFYVGSSDTQYAEDVAESVSIPFNTTLGDYDYFYTFNGFRITNFDDYLALTTDEEKEEFVFQYEKFDLTSKFGTTNADYQTSMRSTKREIVYGNKIGMNPTTFYGDSTQKMRLPGNVFFGIPNVVVPGFGIQARWFNTPARIACNRIDSDCMNNIFVGNCIGNVFEDSAHGNIIGMSGLSNKFGNYAYNNILAGDSFANHINENCHNLHFGLNCRYNNVGANSNTLLITLNSTGNDCDVSCANSLISGISNKIGGYCSNMAVFGNYNIVGNYVTNSAIGDYANDSSCSYCVAHNWSNGIHVAGSMGIEFETGVHGITLPSNSFNVKVLGGSYGPSNNNPLIITDDLSGGYLKYIGKNSNDDIIIWNPADHVIPTSPTVTQQNNGN